MLKNGRAYFKTIVVFTPQDILSMFDHFSNTVFERVKSLFSEQLSQVCRFTVLVRSDQAIFTQKS